MTSDDTLKIKLAEYEALRYEITTFLGLQGQFMSYSIVLSSVILALGAKDADALKVPVILAFLPSPFLILGILYVDVRMRILRVALYIEKELRRTLIDGSPESVSCLGWESFIRQPGEMTTFLWIAEQLRYGVFLVPIFVLWVLLWQNWSYTKHPCLCMFLVMCEAILFFFGLALVMMKLEPYDRTLH